MGRSMELIIAALVLVSIAHGQDASTPDYSTTDMGFYKPRLGDLRRQLRGAVSNMVDWKLGKKTLCPRGTVFCVQTRMCVRPNCDSSRGDYNNGGGNGGGSRYKLSDAKRDLRSLVNAYFYEKTREPERICPQGSVFCLTQHTCVRTQCSANRVNSGDCPPLDPTAPCYVETECLSDSEGCVGNDKCCPTSCGGTVCSAPEFQLPDLSSGDAENGFKPYRVATYVADADPDPISMVGNNAVFETDEAPNSLKFNIATASAGCVWKKGTVENIQLEGQGEPQSQMVWENITSTEEVAITTPISCIPSNLSFHGLAKVNISDDAGINYTFAVVILPAKLRPTIAFKPTNENSTATIYLLEDMPVENISIPVTVTLPISGEAVTLPDEDIIGLLSSEKGDRIYSAYKTKLAKVVKSLTGALGVKLTLLDVTTKIGEYYLMNNNASAIKGPATLYNKVTLRRGGYGAPMLKYVPEKDYAGEFRVNVSGWTGVSPPGAKDLSVENVTFTVKVLNVNDPPTPKGALLDELQHNPRSKWGTLMVPADLTENIGVNVGEVVSEHFGDPEGGSLGMCVVRAVSSAIGEYQYLPAGATNWLTVDVADPGPQSPNGVFRTFRIEKMLEAFGYDTLEELMLRGAPLTTPSNEFAHACFPILSTSRVRFQPSAEYSDKFWDYNSDTQWDYLVWDETVGDLVEGQAQTIELPFCRSCVAFDSVLSFAYMSGDAMRLGCNNKPSPVKFVKDACGVCGGDNSTCIDCNGVFNGGAIMNRCSQCVLGDTGKERDFGRDCKGGCSVGEYEIFPELDDACLDANTDVNATTWKAYCDGVWRGGAKIDSCGDCTGGDTGLSRNYAKDECGVCDGDGSTCTDCAGTPHGTMQTDNCNQCLSRNDPDYNACQAISDIEPVIAMAGVNGTLDIYGASLDDLSDGSLASVTCELSIPGGARVSLVTTRVRFSSYFDVIQTEFAGISVAGSYDVSCDFISSSGGVAILKVDDVNFEVIGFPTVSSLAPNQVQIGAIPSQVIVIGAGFIDTGEIFCFTDCPIRVTRDCRSRTSVATFEAQYINSTAVACMVPRAASSTLNVGVTLKVSVSYTDPFFLAPEDVSEYPTQNFQITAPAPTIESAKFVGACTVTIVFDMTITAVETCDQALDTASVAKLGTDPECFVRGSTLVIRLGTSSTLAAQGTLTLKANAISQRGADNAEFAGSDTVTVATTTETSIKFEDIKAPPVIGDCDSVTIRAKFQGAGCSTLRYNWTATLVGATSDANTITDLADLNTRLSAIDTGTVQIAEDEIIPGETYQFSAYVQTHLGEQSPTKSVSIERRDAPQPLMVDLGSDVVDWDPRRTLKLKAKVTKSDCYAFELTGVTYLWNAVRTSEFNLDDYTGVYAKLPGGEMIGGKTYTITLLAVVDDDPSITAEASVTVTTLSKDLVPYIKRQPVIVAGVANSVKLDASLSTDPDNAYANKTYYTWTCSKVPDGADPTADDITLDSCEIQDPGDQQYRQFESSSLITSDEQQVVEIPGYTLESDATYIFTLLMAKQARSKETSITVVTQEGSPPDASIDAFEGQQNPDEDLKLSAFVTSPLAFSASWSTATGEGFEVLDYTAFGDNTQYDVKFAKRNFPVPLIVEAQYLKPGATYKLVLDVNHADASSQAEIEVTVNAPPECAELSVAPLTGIALNDVFTAEAIGCDDTAEDFPLTYHFSVVNQATDTRRLLSTSPLSDSGIDIKLEKGEFKYRVKVCDQNEVCSVMTSTQVVNVTEPVLDESAVTDLLATISTERATGGESGTAMAAVNYIFSSDDVSDEVKQAGLDIAKDEAKNSLGKANPQADPTGSQQNLEAVVETIVVTKGVTIDGEEQDAVDTTMADSMMEKSKGTIEALVVETDTSTDGTLKRKKRAADESATINAIPIETGESLVLVQVTALEDTAEADIEKDSAVSFFDTLELVWQGVCAGIVSGQTAQVGKTSLVTFRAYSTDFDSLSNVSLYASCETCEEVTTKATFTIGDHMTETYGEWNCTDTDTCYGGCLATGQLNYDILTASSDSIEPFLSTRLSDIVAIHLINPTTYAYVEVNASTPISFNVPLYSTPDVDTYQYMCRGWDTVINDWTDSLCLPAVMEMDNTTNVWTAQCDCFSTGYFGVFLGDEIVDETLITTTEAFVLFKTTTVKNFLNNSDETSIEKVSVTFKIDADAAILDSNYSAAEQDIKQWLITVMDDIEGSRIDSLALSAGSIVVEFDLLPGGPSDIDINSALTKLEKQVLAGAAITIAGVEYYCIVNSFGSTIVPKTTTTTDGEVIPKGNNGNLGMIIGITVGCCLLVILIVVIVAVVLIKKNSGGNKIQHSPRSSEAHMAEVDNYELKKTVASPEEEALYGPAPVPHTAMSAVSRAGAIPIGSRPVSQAKREGTLTPVEQAERI